MNLVHYFDEEIRQEELPLKFTFPFFYTPHSLCVKAVSEVSEYLMALGLTQADKISKGKMLGVLIVLDQNSTLGYLVAYSGQNDGRYSDSYFVPCVFDIQSQDGFFKREEASISYLNSQIEDSENASELKQLFSSLEQKKNAKTLLLNEEKLKLAQNKKNREKKRQEASRDEILLSALIKESQYEKAEFKRLKTSLNLDINAVKQRIDVFVEDVNRLKTQRKERSAELQKRIFDNYRLLNSRGEIRTVNEIFGKVVAPAATGDCAAPKLLQFAYLNNLKPLAMAEFWWGPSPSSEVRQHLCYYASCKEKCEPLLNFMMQGLDVEENPLLRLKLKGKQIELVYEDAYLFAVYKPEGILSVKGRSEVLSLSELIEQTYSHLRDFFIVHRLDMATSGVVLFAKTQEVYRQLQALFASRKVKKRYLAILDGKIKDSEGTIDLPLCPDISDRPRQKVDSEYGKKAITRYKVLENKNNYTLVELYPLTGRTHQLRVHCAHSKGLNTSILGDALYGTSLLKKRMYLHAESLEFIHPFTLQTIKISKEVDFSSCLSL